jgi:hypothetical protein
MTIAYRIIINHENIYPDWDIIVSNDIQSQI